MTIAALSDDLVNMLDGRGRPSPIGTPAAALGLGTLINELISRVNGITDGGSEFDTIGELTAAAGVTVDGVLLKDKRWQPTGVATGEAGVTLKDNLANAFDVKEAANAYLSFVTTNDKERINAGKLLGLPIQTIDMADAQVALVLGTAGAGEVKLTGQILLVDANSGATEDLLLPPEADSAGLVVFVANTGGEDIILKDDGDATTVATISTAECAFAVCDGTTWRGGVVKAT